MKGNARLFNCARCHRQTIICSHCDRGNIYCSSACSQTARKKSLHEAGQRYQNSQQGRAKHAERQRRYRQRQKEKINKVTHQGSSFSSFGDLLLSESCEEKKNSKATVNGIQCHFCGHTCPEYLRFGFMRNYSHHQTQSKSSWPLGP